MMTQIELLDNLWKKQSDVYIAGTPFRDNSPYSAEQLVADLRSSESTKNFVQEQLKGFFALIILNKNTVELVADHVRSIPLFYSTTSNTLVGDNFRKIQSAVDSNINIDSIQIKEYLASGLVLGSDTISSKINQIQAGEYVCLDRSDGSIITRQRYITYRDNPQDIHSEETLLNRAESALVSSFERLIELANGDPIIVPLSAGYDSRLVALMLKRLKYDNIYAYHTVNSTENKKITEQIADDLDIPLTILETTKEDYRTVYQSNNWDRLESSISGYGSTSPRPGQALAMRKIKKQEGIPNHGIIVKGHHCATACLVKPSLLDRTAITTGAVVEQLWLDNYDMCQWSRRKYDNEFLQRILEHTIGQKIQSISDAIQLREQWYWQERSPKRLISHPLEYTTWGYQRWIPLWDAAYMNFWNYVPEEYRVDKRLHKKLVKKLYKETCDRWVEPNKQTESSSTMLLRAEAAVKNTPLERSSRLAYRRLRAFQRTQDLRNIYDKHPIFIFVPYKVFQKFYRGHERYHYFLALDRLGLLPGATSKIEINSRFKHLFSDPLTPSDFLRNNNI